MKNDYIFLSLKYSKIRLIRTPGQPGYRLIRPESSGTEQEHEVSKTNIINSLASTTMALVKAILLLLREYILQKEIISQE